MYTQLLKLLYIAVKKRTSYITKEYIELQHLIGKNSVYDFALRAQERLQHHIKSDLQKFKPHYSIILGNDRIINNQDTSNYFIIHNILGFTNFINGISNFMYGVSILRDQQLVATALCHPLMENFFYAQHEQGAYLNNTKLRKESNYNPKTHKIFTTDAKGFIDIAKSNQVEISNIRITGLPTLDLCLAANNKIDGYYYKNHYHKYDIMPALLINKEANLSYDIHYDQINPTVVTSIKMHNY